MCVFQRENIWGPFLIISPASTLNNWHQEFARFVPKFKVMSMSKEVLSVFSETRKQKQSKPFCFPEFCIT